MTTQTEAAAGGAAETRAFGAEVGKLLHIVANALYSEREVFLRELVSNAADACDKLRYLALTRPELAEGDAAYRIRLSVDRDARTLAVADNGVGMDAAALHENLGTIARSGTGAFLDNLSGDERRDVGLIGRFGVGFYSAFMAASEVEVTTRPAGGEEAWTWRSDGLGSYTVAPGERAGRGTTVLLRLRDDATEFLEEARLRRIVRTYSDHIPFPILLDSAAGGAGEGEPLNEASALWTRDKADIAPEQYTEFYRHAARGFDEPWATLHWRAEGRYEYHALLFVPSERPFDLFHPDRKDRVRLYVRRVFVTDDCEGLVPEYLRFLKGAIDCEDLPLNVSREMLQKNPMLAAIGGAVTRRALAELAARADREPEEYARFWENFGAVLKEGLYGPPHEHRDALLGLARFRSTAREGLASLKQYVADMKEGQERIFYISGESEEAVRASPHLEGFAARGVEVLLLTDPVDDFWIASMFEGYEGKRFSSVTQGAAELDGIAPADGAGDGGEDGDKEAAGGACAAADAAPLIASIKLALGGAVKDVRESARLTDSACCLVAGEGDIDMNLERVLRQHRQVEAAAARVLEINPRHPLIAGLARRVREGRTGPEIEDAAFLLLDQARIVDGEPVADPRAFARRMSRTMEIALAV